MADRVMRKHTRIWWGWARPNLYACGQNCLCFFIFWKDKQTGRSRNYTRWAFKSNRRWKPHILVCGGCHK